MAKRRFAIVFAVRSPSGVKTVGTAPGSRSRTTILSAVKAVDPGKSMWIAAVRNVMGICEKGA